MDVPPQTYRGDRPTNLIARRPLPERNVPQFLDTASEQISFTESDLQRNGSQISAVSQLSPIEDTFRTEDNSPADTFTKAPYFGGYPVESESLIRNIEEASIRHPEPPPEEPSLLMRIGDVFTRERWLWEILCWMSSVGLFCGLVGFLHSFDQRRVPDWPHGLTINAVIAIITTIGKALLISPVSESLSQLKWIWYAKDERKLRDFETLDAASRGESGCLSLIMRGHRGFALVGALLTIVAIAASTFAQQVVTFPIRDISLNDTTALRCENYMPVPSAEELGDNRSPLLGDAPPITQSMKAAIYSGAFESTSNSFPLLSPDCATGNCRWPTFRSLGFCHKFSDISNQIVMLNRSSSAGSKTQWTVGFLNHTTTFPQGSGGSGVVIENLNEKEFVKLYTGPNPDPRPEPGLFHDIVLPTAHFLAYFIPDNLASPPVVKGIEAVLYPCIQDHNVTIKDGRLIPNVTEVPSVQSGGYGESSGVLTLETADKETYSYNFIGLYSFFTFLFTGSWNMFSAGRIMTGADLANTFWAIAFTGAKNMSNVDILMKNLATSMSNEIRTSGTLLQMVTGEVRGPESYIDVHWGWLAFQACLIVASGLFLLITIIQSEYLGVEAWKSSSLATLRGFTYATRDEQGMMVSNKGLERTSKETIVFLERGHSGWGLTTSSNHIREMK